MRDKTAESIVPKASFVWRSTVLLQNLLGRVTIKLGTYTSHVRNIYPALAQTKLIINSYITIILHSIIECARYKVHYYYNYYSWTYMYTSQC